MMIAAGDIRLAYTKLNIRQQFRRTYEIDIENMIREHAPLYARLLDSNPISWKYNFNRMLENVLAYPGKL